eukprot:12381259-Alexandrium_andersonii.AAC.1
MPIRALCGEFVYKMHWPIGADAEFKTHFPGASSEVVAAPVLEACFNMFSLSEEPAFSDTPKLEYVGEAEEDLRPSATLRCLRMLLRPNCPGLGRACSVKFSRACVPLCDVL